MKYIKKYSEIEYGEHYYFYDEFFDEIFCMVKGKERKSKTEQEIYEYSCYNGMYHTDRNKLIENTVILLKRKNKKIEDIILRFEEEIKKGD